MRAGLIARNRHSGASQHKLRAKLHIFLEKLEKNCGVTAGVLEFGPGFPAAYFEGDSFDEDSYLNSFSEMLQDFSEEQEQNAAPPQPKYLPAATYEERPEPTTAGILGTLVLSMVPIVGWILLLVWAFDGQAAVFQKRLARALLLFKLILWLVLLIAGALTAYISYEIIQMSAYSAFAFSGMT